MHGRRSVPESGFFGAHPIHVLQRYSESKAVPASPLTGTWGPSFCEPVRALVQGAVTSVTCAKQRPVASTETAASEHSAA